MRRRRQAFTLVELLVAMALVMFIMAILSQAFVAATQTFRDLKSAGDMAEKLRATTNILRRYLAADHFEGKRRLSDPNFWQDGQNPGSLSPPREGFFRVWHGAPSTLEGADPDGIPSFRSNAHALHFTVKLRGNRRDNYFSTIVPNLANGSSSPLPGLLPSAVPTVYSAAAISNYSPFTTWPAQPETRYEDYPAAGGAVYKWQWAEVAFFLRATVDNANGTPLYGLYMHQQLAVPDVGSGTALGVSASQLVPSLQSQIPGYLEVSCQPIAPTDLTKPLYFNSPLDLTMPVRRFGMTSGNQAGLPFQTDSITGQLTYPTYVEQMSGNTTLAAADLLLANVISFDVRLLTAQPPALGLTGGPYAGAKWDAFEDLFQLTNPSRLPNYYPVNNSVFAPFAPQNGGSGPLVFDTWSSNRDDTFYSPLNTANTPPVADYSSWNFPNQSYSIPILNNSANTGQIIIRAVQVTLRIWDQKTEKTRQITFVQEL